MRSHRSGISQYEVHGEIGVASRSSFLSRISDFFTFHSAENSFSRGVYTGQKRGKGSSSGKPLGFLHPHPHPSPLPQPPAVAPESPLWNLWVDQNSVWESLPWAVTFSSSLRDYFWGWDGWWCWVGNEAPQWAPVRTKQLLIPGSQKPIAHKWHLQCVLGAEENIPS